MCSPAKSSDFISLEKLISISEDVNSEQNHFSMVQFPLNLSENGFLLEKNQAEGTKPPADICKEKDILTVSFRPFRDQNDFRFIDYPSHSEKDLSSILKEAFDLCRILEKSYQEYVQSDPRLPSYQEIALSEVSSLFLFYFSTSLINYLALLLHKS